jgi:hypothetical protein
MKRLTRYEISAAVDVRDAEVIFDVVNSFSLGSVKLCFDLMTELSQKSFGGVNGLSMM